MHPASLGHRVSVLPLLPGPAPTRSRPHPSDGRRRQRGRDPGASPPTGGATPSSATPTVHLVGSGAHGRLGQTRATGALGSVPRHTRDDPPLAPRSCPPTLDLSPPRARTAIPSQQDRGADRPLGPGEPPMGVPAHRRRAAKAGRHRLEGKRRQRAQAPGPATGASTGRADLDRVPRRSGQGPSGHRLLHRRERPCCAATTSCS